MAIPPRISIPDEAGELAPVMEKLVTEINAVVDWINNMDEPSFEQSAESINLAKRQQDAEFFERAARLAIEARKADIISDGAAKEHVYAALNFLSGDEG